MQKYLEIDGRTYYAFEEPDFVGPRLVERFRVDPPQARVPPDQPVDKPQSRKFDWAFGVILPVACFALDPGVFGSRYGYREGAFGEVAVFAYVLSFAAVMGTVAWLLWGEKLGAALPFLAGLLAVASVVSLLIALALFPFSMIGLIYLIGALGFLPFFASRAFMKAYGAAFRSSAKFCDPVTAWHSFAIGALAAIVIPYLANLYF